MPLFVSFRSSFWRHYFTCSVVVMRSTIRWRQPIIWDFHLVHALPKPLKHLFQVFWLQVQNWPCSMAYLCGWHIRFLEHALFFYQQHLLRYWRPFHFWARTGVVCQHFWTFGWFKIDLFSASYWCWFMSFSQPHLSTRPFTLMSVGKWCRLKSSNLNFSSLFFFQFDAIF